METQSPDNIKHRLLSFSALHPDDDQAGTAAELLADMAGVLSAEPVSATALEVSYDVFETTLLEIETMFDAHGLHVDRNLMYRIKSALYHYTEETQRANVGCSRGESNCTRKVFAQSFEKRNHECRDPKPEHWRKYF